MQKNTWALLILFLVQGPKLIRGEEGQNPKPLPIGQKLCGRVDVPLVFYDRSGFVRVTVSGKPMTLLVDPASLTIVNTDRLDLPIIRKIKGAGITATGSTTTRWQLVGLDKLEIGEQTVTRLQVMAKSLSQLEMAFGREVDGILGNDVLVRWDTVKIDYKSGRLILEGACHEP